MTAIAAHFANQGHESCESARVVLQTGALAPACGCRSARKRVPYRQ